MAVGEEAVVALLRANGLYRGPVRLSPLKGGYLNEVLSVTTGTARLVLKRFAPATSGTLFPNLPADEARALSVLGPLGVAPRLRGYWPDQALMIYDYAPGGPWGADTGAGTGADTAAIARLLLAKEAADPTGFRPMALMPEAILAEADALFARCADPPRNRPAPRDLPPPARLSLVHTDLGPGNLIGQAGRFQIIDWQCPGAGDLVEDIYSFLSPAFQILSEHAPLTGDEVRDFWAALGRDNLRARHHALRPFFAWRMAAYCLWRSQTRAEPEIRARYAKAFAAELIHMGDDGAG